MLREGYEVTADHEATHWWFPARRELFLRQVAQAAREVGKSRLVLSSVLVAVAVLSISPAVALALTIRTTCRDGNPNARVVSRGHHRILPTCDLDGAADGVCTFYDDPIVLDCAINHEAGCQDVCDDAAPPPCPFANTLALPLRPNGRRAKRIVLVRRGRFPPERLVMQCLPASQAQPTTTTITLPGVPNLSGVWTLPDNQLVEGCPPATGPDTPTLGPTLTIQQTGTSLAACAMGYLNFMGVMSGSGFTSDTTWDLQIGPYQWTATVSGTVQPGDEIVLTERWKLLFTTCENLRIATMTRSEPPCVSHQDCIDVLGPCSRCLGGRCESHPPFCRPAFFRLPVGCGFVAAGP